MGSTDCMAFKLPECWNDDVRMTALFATPRNESLNPQDWAGKYKFWKEIILEWASMNRKMIINVEEVNKAFCRKGKYPASINRVLEEMHKQGDIVDQNQYIQHNAQSTWASWGISLVKTSVAWSWKKVLSSLTEVEKGVISYVVPSVLEEKCSGILQLPVASSEEVIELEELTDQHPDFFPNSEETQIVLNHLQKLGKIAIDASSEQTMIKFLVPTVKTPKPSQLNTSVWSISPTKSKEKPSAEITEVDRSLATLKRTEKLLADEIDSIEEEMSTLEQTARTRLKEGARGLAKAALYRRKQLQTIFDKRNQALANIQTMKLQLSQAKTDSKVMEAYKMGLSALKKSFADLPLNEETVQDTLFELESVLEQHRDIENALSNTIATEETESDLEEELMNILAEAETTDPEPELDLPSAPTDSPRAAEESSKSRLPVRN